MNYITDLLWAYEHIKGELNRRGVGLYNLSRQSKIDVVPYMTIEDFKNL